MKTINGLSLKEMVISGANNLFNCYPEVDALNVFPVPDGDTGTNMNLTISSGAKEVANRNDNNVYDIAKAFSKGLLMGARGNSGVILSQIFRGFSVALKDKSEIGATDLAEAFMSGKEVAYKAVMKPVEGTILTVIRESAEALNDAVEEDWTIEQCFDCLLTEARASLARTPDLLPVLKEVGVVDSGGTGLLKILEGFASAVNGKIIEKAMATVTETTSAASEVQGDDYGYCTEFLLRLPADPTVDHKKIFREKNFSAFLNANGNSIVMVRDEEILKVHIHTLTPGYVIDQAQKYGEFVKIKIENMSEQHTELVEQGKAPDQKAEPKEYALIAVAAGKGVEELFKEYRVDYVVTGGQTMNPSTEDFIKAIKTVNAKKIFILPNNSNIVMAASQACDVCEEGVMAQVIPSKTIPQGLTACMMFNPEDEFEANKEAMNEALANVKTGQVTFAIKDTSIDGVEVKKDEFIGISGKQILCSNKNKVEATVQTIRSMIDEYSSIITLIYGEGTTEEEVNAVTSVFAESNPDIEIDVRDGGQPVYSFIIGVE